MGVAGAAVEARGLRLVRDGRRVLDGVDFEVFPGEVLAVIGPNGAGKTTLLECLVGLRRPDAGSVRHGGRALQALGDFARVFAFMPDDAPPPAEVSVATLLAHARRCGEAPPALAAELTDRLGLRPLVGARAGELSRGERRRVALFLALALERPVVVLDEPFGAFDPLQLLDILAVVRARASAGRAVVASVHQMTDAEKIADRVLLISAGRVVAFGTRAELGLRAGLPGAPLEETFLALLGGGGAGAPA
ncbi:MAG: ABC transporter ATP-binding protein [Deltaproteobacteria bacterium]|nr:ABC transporter ATP-binding protein [Deltaproteobacteria bacterium]